MKIDTSSIVNYDTLPDDVKASIEAIEIPDIPDMSQFIAKDTFDKKASEAAEWKRKYNSTLSEAEQARLMAEEAQKATNDRLAELERKDRISTTKDKYIANGFSVELAQATAEAFVDGDMDVVLENLTKHATDVATAAKDEALHSTPKPPASGGSDYGKIDYDAEREKALAAGDYTKAAYYARQKIEQK